MIKTKSLYLGIGIVSVLALLVISASFQNDSTTNEYQKVTNENIMDISSAPQFGEMTMQNEIYNRDIKTEIDETVKNSYIIKTGNLSITISDAKKTADEISIIANKYNGSVINRSLYEYENETSGYVTLEITAEYFDNAMDDIKALANTVESDTTDINDITETVLDIDARLRNAQAEETRYLDVLKKANTVDEILNVESHLSMVREKIERYQTKINYYQTHSSKSTITVYLTEEVVIGIQSNFRPLQIAIEAFQTVIEIFQEIISMMIYIIIISGTIIAPAFLIYLLGKFIYKKKIK